MPEFTYTARSMSGEMVSGTINASTEREVVNTLSGQSLFPIKVSTELEKKPLTFGRGISDQKIAVFYEQLASFMSNGVPMLQVIDDPQRTNTLAGIQRGLGRCHCPRRGWRHDFGQFCPASKNIQRDGHQHVSCRCGRRFPRGGASTRVARFTEQQSELKSRTIGALIYPAVLATIGTDRGGGVVDILCAQFWRNFSAAT